jgi:hypothetical protein
MTTDARVAMKYWAIVADNHIKPVSRGKLNNINYYKVTYQAQDTMHTKEK